MTEARLVWNRVVPAHSPQESVDSRICLVADDHPALIRIGRSGKVAVRERIFETLNQSSPAAVENDFVRVCAPFVNDHVDGIHVGQMSNLVYKSSEDCQPIIPADSHKRAGLIDHASCVDLLSHLQAVLVPKPAPKFDQLLQNCFPAQLVDYETRQGEMLSG